MSTYQVNGGFTSFSHGGHVYRVEDGRVTLPSEQWVSDFVECGILSPVTEGEQPAPSESPAPVKRKKSA